MDGHGVAKLCDFGLARLLEWEGPAGMTTTSPYGGTMLYKAYELFKSRENPYPLPSFASDVYALGCVILEASTFFLDIVKDRLSITNFNCCSLYS